MGTIFTIQAPEQYLCFSVSFLHTHKECFTAHMAKNPQLTQRKTHGQQKEGISENGNVHSYRGCPVFKGAL